MSSVGKVRHTLCIRWHANGAIRLHGVFTEFSNAERVATSWRRAIAKRGLDVTIEVTSIYPATALWRDKYNGGA